MIEAAEYEVRRTVSPSVHAFAFSDWLTVKVLDNEVRKASLVISGGKLFDQLHRDPDCSASPLIVVVDDESYIAITLAEILQRRGYLVVWYTDPLAALASMQSRRPGLLLTDFTMPGCNGLDLAIAVKLVHPDCPILMITANADRHALAARISTAGLPISLESKPLKICRLLSSVADLISAQP